MSKQKKKQQLAPSGYSGYSEFTTDQTLGPEATLEETTVEYPDATSSDNLDEEAERPPYTSTPTSFVDKYIMRGNIWRVAFLLLAAASMWIFIQDNSSGGLKQGDWWAIIWTIQKCMMLSVFIILLLLLHSFTNWVRKKLKKS